MMPKKTGNVLKPSEFDQWVQWLWENRNCTTVVQFLLPKMATQTGEATSNTTNVDIKICRSTFFSKAQDVASLRIDLHWEGMLTQGSSTAGSIGEEFLQNLSKSVSTGEQF